MNRINKPFNRADLAALAWAVEQAAQWQGNFVPDDPAWDAHDAQVGKARAAIGKLRVELEWVPVVQCKCPPGGWVSHCAVHPKPVASALKRMRDDKIARARKGGS